ncbi:MAG: hypothetical protein E7170_02520 [Firmicutes bacterium]|nr:hypothetical protein [Bacillota bacterium]
MEKSVADIFIKGDIKTCYDFFNSKIDDSIEVIREKFYYMLMYMELYKGVIHRYYPTLEDPRMMYDIVQLNKYWRVIADNYLAIILHKKGNDFYKPIIDGILFYNSRHKCPTLNENIQKNSIEHIFKSFDDYFLDLFDINQGGRCGVFDYTSSLSTILLYEKELIGQNKEIKVLRPKTKPKYDDFRIHF